MMQAFSDQWFNKYQKALLLYANTIGRNRLKINTNKKIVKILPHAVFWKEDNSGTLSALFQPRTPIADRLVMDLHPFWKLLHSIDMNFLAKQLSLNFGFDTLTTYPDRHPETDTFDGMVCRYVAGGESFATIQAGNGTYSNDSDGTNEWAILVAHTTTDLYTTLRRGIILFKTSNLTAAATIVSATYGIYCSAGPYIELGTDGFCLVASDPASNTAIADSDFQRTWGTVNFIDGPPDLNEGISINTWNVFDLNAAGLAAISKTGITKFGHRLEVDRAASIGSLVWGSGKKTGAEFYSTDVGATPGQWGSQLVVTYTLPSTRSRTIIVM